MAEVNVRCLGNDLSAYLLLRGRRLELVAEI